MAQAIAMVTVALCAGCAAFGQAGEKPPEFEVASVKAAEPRDGPGPRFAGTRGGPGTDDPGRVTYTNLSLKSLLMTAYDMKAYQVTGPSWMESEYRYDIAAKVPDDATKEQVKLMLRSLLAERFKLVLHREQKEMPVYELVVAKGGPKLKEAAPDPSAPPGGRGGFHIRVSSRSMTLTANAMGISGLLGTLAQLGRPVFDKTGLTGLYDITLEYAPVTSTFNVVGASSDAPGQPGARLPDASETQVPSLVTAIQQQLGLKLEPARATVELLAIDKAEKMPVEN